MKKVLVILICGVLTLSMIGCEKDNDDLKVETKGEQEAKEDIKDESKEEIKDESKDEVFEDDKEFKNEVTDESKQENSQDKKEENTKEENKTEEIKKEEPKEDASFEKPSCTPKKFDKTYSYVYETKDECRVNGYTAFDEVSANIDDTIFSFGCSEIIDECGTTWYGVYFNKYSNDTVIKVYY